MLSFPSLSLHCGTDSRCVCVSVCTLSLSFVTHNCCPYWSPSIYMFCVVSGAGAGYGPQQTGEFPCILSPKKSYTHTHTHPFTQSCVSFVTRVHHIAIHRSCCVSITVFLVSYVLHNWEFKYTVQLYTFLGYSQSSPKIRLQYYFVHFVCFKNVTCLLVFDKVMVHS